MLFFSWRNILIRYKQTLLGAAWAVLQPLFGMVIFSIFFGKLANVSSDGVPYPVFSYAALVPWLFFANSLTQSTESLTSGAGLIRKIFFPRMVLPLSNIISGLVDFGIAFILLIVMMLYYGIYPTLNTLFLPLLVLLAALTSAGAGIWLTALNARYRDVRYAAPFLVQAWMFATPVVYPASLLPDKWRILYALNPMAGVIEGFRWALLGTDTAPGKMIIVSVIAAILILISGAVYFIKTERKMADVI